jgi:hypothetical protein
MVTNRIPEGYDLRKILEMLLDELSKQRWIDDMEVRRIIDEGKPNQAT